MKAKDWNRKELSFKITEPKRFWHYLGIKQKEYDYTVSFYVKSEDELLVTGVLTETNKNK